MNIYDGYMNPFDVTKSNQDIEFMKALGIPVSGDGYGYGWSAPSVLASDLVDIFNDEKKLKKMLSRLKLKAFW